MSVSMSGTSAFHSGPSTAGASAPIPEAASVTTYNYRRCLRVGVSALLQEVGYHSATHLALETLLEVLQAFISELGRSSRAFADVACRSEPMHTDVLLALTEMGISTAGLYEYAFRTGRRALSTPPTAQPYKPTAILRTNDGPTTKPQMSSYLRQLPGLPELPDAHAFVRTPTHKQPITDYERVREKAASQKRDVERALTRFIAKTGKTHSLFNTDDTNLFPLISCSRQMVDQPLFPAYVSALLFKDQIFEEDEREFQSKKKKEDEEGPSKEKSKDDGETKEELRQS